MLLLLTLIFAIIPLLVIYSWLKWEQEDAKMGISGPPTLPVLGNLVELWKSARSFKEFEKFLEYTKTYGDTFRVRLGPKLMICTRDVKIMEQIANDPKFIKSHEYRFFKPWWGEGLVLSNGEKWMKFRKLLTPAFHFQILERFLPIFHEQTDVLVEKLKNLEDEEAIDVTSYLHSFSLDVIAETAMGVKLNTQLNVQSKFVDYNAQVSHMIYKRIFNPFLANDFIWKILGYERRANHYIKYIQNYIIDIITKRREILLSSDLSKRPKRSAFLDIMLLSDQQISNEEIRSETMVFMFAGHETTASTLGFFLYCVAKYQNVQKKLLEEIRKNEEEIKELTLQNINSYKYLDCVIRETLRMFPISAFTPKMRTEDLKIGDIFIPKETTVMTLVLASHMNEKYFESPEKFIPERFDSEVDCASRNPYAYQPFSAGLRNCLGQRFAVLEMKVAAIKILTEFEVSLGWESFRVDRIQSNTMKSKNGIHLKFKKRF
ncbi:cytochrome P450 4V2-like [Culicoides brevitarsis]|uniref:cytochrome P450 4V2-like n=1 Tax=Culicoides brevitarsis TaxID=469753 RepID=UPI00307CAC94